MSRSLQEELLSVLWIIAALLAFNGGHEVWGWVFAIKGAFDTLTSISLAVYEGLRFKRARQRGQS